MQRLATVLLRHETPQGGHYDWLLEDPVILGLARTSHSCPQIAAKGNTRSLHSDLRAMPKGLGGSFPGSKGVSGGERTLWAARVNVPSGQWSTAGVWSCQQIDHHRPLYLRYQGLVGGTPGRGWVKRVDEGWFTPRLWTADRLVLEVTMRQFTGWLACLRQGEKLWQASLLSASQVAGF
ncbi:MAG: hypothetical protein IT443_00335 [Phycisphaeraceae bacterium]|nr:hypothetical protein [Phycisphaeraceae bacterium]